MTRARDVANLIGSGNYSSTTFTATAGQTAFTISHTQGFIQVFMNGLLLDETVDYTSNGSAVTLTSGAAAGDEIEVVAYNTFSVGDAVPASGGTFSGNVTHSGTVTNSGNVTVGGTLGVTGATTMSNNLTVSGGAINATGTSTLTNPEADLGLYHTFKNLSSDVNTGVGIALGSNNNGGATIYAQRTGANNEHKLGFSVRNNSGSSYTRMAIDGSGRVTKPYQVYFHVKLNSNVSHSGTSSAVKLNAWVALGTYGGLGSDFSSANQRFIAPVDGRYLFNYSGLHNSGTTSGGYSRAYTYVNGAVVIDGLGDDNTQGNYQRIAYGTILDLSANDYVEIYINGTNSNGFVYSYYSTWSGYLLG